MWQQAIDIKLSLWFWKLCMNSVWGLAGWETLCPCQTVCTWLYERFQLSLKFQIFCVIWLIIGTSVVTVQSTRLPSWGGASHMTGNCFPSHIHTYIHISLHMPGYHAYTVLYMSNRWTWKGSVEDVMQDYPAILAINRPRHAHHHG